MIEQEKCNDSTIPCHIFEFVNFEHLQNHFHKDVLTS